MVDWGVEGWGISMKFLGLDLLKDVTLEVARATKESHLGLAEWHTQFKFRLKKLQHTNKVCNLKQLVLARFYRLCKFSRNNKSGGNRFPPLKAKNILRITTIPILKSTSVRIIPNFRLGAQVGEKFF